MKITTLWQLLVATSLWYLPGNLPTKKDGNDHASPMRPDLGAHWVPPPPPPPPSWQGVGRVQSVSRDFEEIRGQLLATEAKKHFGIGSIQGSTRYGKTSPCTLQASEQLPLGRNCQTNPLVHNPFGLSAKQVAQMLFLRNGDNTSLPKAKGGAHISKQSSRRLSRWLWTAHASMNS